VAAGQGLVDPSAVLNLVSSIELFGPPTTITSLAWTAEALTPGVSPGGVLIGAVANAMDETFVVPACALEAGAAYRFNSSVTLSTGRVDSGSLEVRVNNPPGGGSLIAPATAVALDEVSFSAPSWLDPETGAANLSYTFSYAKVCYSTLRYATLCYARLAML
jgi:hypothetical protein